MSKTNSSSFEDAKLSRARWRFGALGKYISSVLPGYASGEKAYRFQEYHLRYPIHCGGVGLDVAGWKIVGEWHREVLSVVAEHNAAKTYVVGEAQTPEL